MMDLELALPRTGAHTWQRTLSTTITTQLLVIARRAITKKKKKTYFVSCFPWRVICCLTGGGRQILKKEKKRLAVHVFLLILFSLHNPQSSCHLINAVLPAKKKKGKIYFAGQVSSARADVKPFFSCPFAFFLLRTNTFNAFEGS